MKNNSLKLILLTYLLSITCFASPILPLNESTVSKLYADVVTTHIRLRERLATLNNTKSEKELNILKKEHIGETFPKLINSYQINYLSSEDLKKQPSSFNLVMLSPIELQRDTIIIRVGDYAAEKDLNGELFFSYSVGTECAFQYNKKKKEYILIYSKTLHL